MPRKKSDKAILAEIRQVIKDMDGNLMIKNYKEAGCDYEPEFYKLKEPSALEIIRHLSDGTEDVLTRDYKRTKAEKAAPAP